MSKLRQRAPGPRSTVRLMKSPPPPIQTMTVSSSVPFLSRISQSVQFSAIYLRSEWAIFWVATFVKIMLMPAYRSTDFEVHRNWLAVTHSLPLSQWYTDTTSEWTLDYPPFFAYYEYCLSLIAQWVDPAMLVVANLGYHSNTCVYFQRLSVIGSDLVLFYAINSFLRSPRPWLPVNHRHSRTLLLYLAFMSPGLMFVDHIHFQYNGLLLGIFIYSLSLMNNGSDLLSGLTFAILINFKHIFLYVAPVYFIYLLRHYCLEESHHRYEGWEQFNQTIKVKKFVFRWSNFVKLGVVVSLVFALSFGPFIYYGQLWQIKERLFPFKRGLSHAYWAPNLWATYNGLDVALTFALSRLGMIAKPASVSSMTSGLVHDIQHTVLPNITPSLTFLLTLLSMAPVLVRLYKFPHPSLFQSSIIYVSLCSFMLGWHVHEKAILITLLPLALLACDRVSDTNIYLELAIIGNYSLFPLLYRTQELLVKILLFLIYLIISVIILYDYHSQQQYQRRIAFHGLFSRAQKFYFVGFLPLFVLTEIVLPLAAPRLTFAPLMLTSVYSSIGMLHVWVKCYEACKLRIALIDYYSPEEEE